MDASLTWQAGLSFEGKVTGRGGFPLQGTIGDEDSSGAYSPMELMLLSLAGCTAMDVISILEKKRQNVTAFRVRAHGERASEHPKVFTSIHLDYDVTGHGVEEPAVTRAIELSQTKYCPAYAMLVPVVPITTSYRIVEAQDATSG